jgi:hypothetical protein
VPELINFARYLPPFVRRLLQYVLGFGVGFGVGMAPFLGTYKVRFFPALLSLYPMQMQQSLIPLSAFLLGTVAVAVQYYSFNHRSDAILDRYFGRLLVSLLAAFLILVVLYKIFVLAVPIEATGNWVRVVIGLSRSAQCCPPEVGDRECVKDVSVDPAEIDSCWKYVPLVELALSIPYLFLLSGFVALVGLLLFKEKGRAPDQRAPARAAAKSTARPRTGARRSDKAPPPARPAGRRR